MSPEARTLSGITLEAWDRDAALEWVLERAAQPGSGAMAVVATVNMSFLTLARRDQAFAALLRTRTALNLVDGRPVAWLLALRGVPRPARAAGSDLTGCLLRDVRTRALGVYLLGDTEETLADVSALAAREGWAPTLRGAASPTRAQVDDEAASRDMVARINTSGASVLLVAFGAPRQEAWMARWAESLAPAVGMGIGGSLKFLARPASRAPQWMQASGLEWLHRMLHEPARLGPRYLRDFGELALQLWDVVRLRLVSTLRGPASTP